MPMLIPLILKTLLFAFAQLTFSFHGICLAQTGRTPVRIGVIAPLTGGNAERGAEITRTIRIYEDLLKNQSKKFLFQFVIDDGKCGLGSASSTIAQKFIKLDHIRFLITGCSGETIQAGLLANKEGVLTIGVLASDPAVRTLGEYVFRTYVDIERGIELISHEIINDTGGEAAVLNEDLAFTQTIKKLLEKYLGQQIIFSQDFPSETADFGALLTSVKSRRPKALYFNCSGPRCLALLVNKARALGLSQPIYSYFMPAERSFLEATGENSEGIKFIDTPELADSSPEFKTFMTAYTAAYPQGPLVEFLIRTTHDAIKSIVDGIENVGPDAAAVKDFLGGCQFQGALGPVRYDAAGDIAGLSFVIKQIVHGKPKMLAD